MKTTPPRPRTIRRALELQQARAAKRARSTAVPGCTELPASASLGLAAAVEPRDPARFASHLSARSGVGALSPEQRAAFSVDPEVLVERYAREIVEAYTFAASVRPAVTVFGSARTPPDHPEYEHAKHWGEALFLANLYAVDRPRAVKAILSGEFGAPAVHAVTAIVLGASATIHGAQALGATLGAVGGLSSDLSAPIVARLLDARLESTVVDVLMSAVRSGAGPGIMDAVLRAYVEAFDRFVDLDPTLPGRLRERFEIQGSRIVLDFEQATSPVFHQDRVRAPLRLFQHFDPRREALMLNATGVVSEIGGLGTLNELFVALRFGLPVVNERGYYGEILGRIREAWQAHGFSPEATENMLLADGVADGFPMLAKVIAESPSLRVPSIEEARQKARDFVFGIVAVAQMETAVSVSGSSRLSADDPDVEVAARIAARSRMPIRIGGGGALFDRVAEAVKGQGEAAPALQAVVLKGDAGPSDVEARADASFAVESPNVHKVLLYENTDGAIFTKGGDGVFDELFELLCLMQTGKAPERPLILIGDAFWTPILDAIHEGMATRDPPTIKPDDLRFITVVKSSGAPTEADGRRPYGVTDEDGAVQILRAQRARRLAAARQV